MFVTKNRGWLLLAEIPFRGEQFDQYLHLKDTRDNRRAAERLKREIQNAILAGTFEKEFARRFPNSPHLARLGLE